MIDNIIIEFGQSYKVNVKLIILFGLCRKQILNVWIFQRYIEIRAIGVNKSDGQSVSDDLTITEVAIQSFSYLAHRFIPCYHAQWNIVLETSMYCNVLYIVKKHKYSVIFCNIYILVSYIQVNICTLSQNLCAKYKRLYKLYKRLANDCPNQTDNPFHVYT